MKKKSKPRIPIAEDETVISMQLESCLTSMGYDVVGVTSSGEEAIDMARDLRPDLLMTDIIMPGRLDGIEAAKVIKAELGIPVIFITAHKDEKLVERAKEVKPLDYIMKPLNSMKISAALEDLIGRSRGPEI